MQFTNNPQYQPSVLDAPWEGTRPNTTPPQGGASHQFTDPTAPLVGSIQGAGAGEDNAPWSQPQTSTTTQWKPQDATDRGGNAPTGGSELMGITQLPDGVGGAISVPPIELAPPSVPMPAPSGPPADATPWASTSAPQIGAAGTAGAAPAASAPPATPQAGAAAGGVPAEGYTVAQQRAMNDAAGNYRAVTPESAAQENADRGLYAGLILNPNGTRTLAPWLDQLPPEVQATARAHAGDVGYVKPSQYDSGTAGDSPEGQAAEIALMRTSGGPAYANYTGGPPPADTAPWAQTGATQMPQMPQAPQEQAGQAQAGQGGASPQSAPWNAPAGSSTFDASHNLINAQLSAAPDARVTAAQQTADAALQKQLNGPDRLAIAKQFYDAMTSGANEDYQHNLVDATNAAGAHGALGSGMLTNRYGDLFGGLTRAKEAAKNSLLAQATAGTIGDTQANTAAARTAETQALNTQQAGNALTASERQYQEGLAQRALQERILQQQMEQTQQQQNFDNAARLFGIGNANNPTGTYETAAGQAAGEAGAAGSQLQQLIQAWMQRNGAQSLAGG